MWDLVQVIMLLYVSVLVPLRIVLGTRNASTLQVSTSIEFLSGSPRPEPDPAVGSRMFGVANKSSHMIVLKQ